MVDDESHLKSSIWIGDALDKLNVLADASVQLCLTSPPYNIGKEYEKDDRKPVEQYVIWMEKIFELVFKKLKVGGSFCLQIGNSHSDGGLYPLDYLLLPSLLKMGFTFRNRIIWRFNFGLHARKRFSGRYEVIIWVTKGDGYKFNLDSVRIPQLYPGKRHSRKKKLAGQPSGNPHGKNPSDYWEFDPKSAFFDDPVWNIPNVKSNHLEKTVHPCQFPIELAERCILALTDIGDIVLDPFAGVGTTVIAADCRERIGVGIDRSEAYVLLARDRLAQARAGDLPIRQAGVAPRQPKSGERVATIPNEWVQLDGGEP